MEAVLQAAESGSLRSRALIGIGDIRLAAGHYQRAIDAFDKVISSSQSPDAASYAQCRIADALYLTGRYDEAALAYQSCLVNFPASASGERASFMLALTYLKKGDLRASSVEWRRFLAMYPASDRRAGALLSLAGSLYGQERYDDALPVFRAAFRCRASDEVLALARYGAAWCYRRAHREKAALGECAYIVNHYPRTGIAGDVEYWCGEYYYDRGDLDRAGRYFSALLRSSPGSGLADHAQFQGARILEAQGRLSDAARAFMEVGQRHQSSALAPEALTKAGDVLERLGRVDEASSCFEEAAAQSADQISRSAAYRKLGSLYRREKDYGRAVETLRKAFTAGSDELNAQVQYEIGECLEESGDLRAARDEFLAIPSQYPKSSFWSIRAELASAKISERLGEPQEAAALYEALAAKNVEESKFARQRIGELKKR